METVFVSETKDDFDTDASDFPMCQIFLIEDDFDDRVLAQRELEECESVRTVMSFRDGKELTDHMRMNGFMDHSVMLYTPLMLLVDLEMPRKDGLAVIQELKSDPFLKPIPLVVITGSESQEKIRKALDLGASGVFRKPLNRHMLNSFFKDAWQWPPRELWHYSYFDETGEKAYS